MSSQFPKNTNFTAFNSAADEASQTEQVTPGGTHSSEERAVAALERIAEQLTLLRADLRSFSDYTSGSVGKSPPSSAPRPSR